ncbi:ComEC/Rec2 family competence protein, partial [Candidatus Woesebacteria bacterium]|nr:ComEC/Rec2 family competence protein [Candidatus Woesebacteria bacterium]
LPPEEAGLAVGMLLGGTQDMTSSQIAAYRQAGLSHIVAASGYNVTLVAAWVAWLVSKLFGRKLAIPIIVVTIIGYAIMAGATAAVVRAAVMAVITSVGLIFGRESDIRWVLLVSVLLMLLFNPNYVSDIGFQLSVAATAGLVFFNPRNVWWTTIAAQISTMPIILHYFGNLSLVAPLSNILVLWTVPPIMQISAVAAATGGWLAYLAWPLLKWCNLSTYYFSSLSFSSLTLKPLSWGWVIGYYLVLYLVYKLKFETKSQFTPA